MLDDHDYWMCYAMRKMGGSFVVALAECYERADKINKAKLVMAFRDLLQKYHDEGLKLKEQNDGK